MNRGLKRLLFLLCAAASVLLGAGAAVAQPKAGDFDHLRTGFALTGAHANARCESCHLGGVFKGTPKDCESCHVGGGRWAKDNLVRPNEHFPTTQSCDACHTTRSFAGARMNHSGVPRGSCASCHNGTQAPGKPATHLRTSASCDSCHTSAAWRPAAGFDHAGVAPGTCASCHNGGRAAGPGAGHVPYTQVAATAGASCDTCHKAGFTRWTPARLHASVAVTAQCATCHAGSKPNTPVHAGQTVCESCHRSSSGWGGAKVDHAGFGAATNCASCHNGSAATGKSATHIPTGAAGCFACHSTAAWRPTKFNHAQVATAAQCASCHNGAFPPADGKPANHVPYPLVAASAAANCDTCHKAGFTAWTPARFHANVAVTAQCATCHAAIKPATPVHAGQTVCESCHKSTAGWAGARVDHASFTAATNCLGCHNGSAATGKSATHIPTGAANCIACHSTAGWRPARFNHTQVPVAAQCASCHSGAFPPADGKPANHVPYPLVAAAAAANCDTCHKSGFTAWTPARFHANVAVTTQCATCHAADKPATPVHAGQTVCESCHRSTTGWAGARVDHASFTAATNCSGCHNGNAATGKPANHIPSGATNCIACHSTSTWRPSRFNHTQVVVAGQCASCHNGAYPPADGKPANHVPYQLVAGAAAANCDACHRSGFTSWANARVHANLSVTGQCKACHNGAYVAQGATAKMANHIPEAQLLGGAAMECNACHTSTGGWGVRMNHNGSLGGGAGWCKACHASGTSWAGSGEKKPLTHRTKTPPAIDCSESGCHRPLGSRGSTYREWD